MAAALIRLALDYEKPRTIGDAARWAMEVGGATYTYWRMRSVVVRLWLRLFQQSGASFRLGSQVGNL